MPLIWRVDPPWRYSRHHISTGAKSRRSSRAPGAPDATMRRLRSPTRRRRRVWRCHRGAGVGVLWLL